MSGWPRRGGWRERTGSGTRDGPRGPGARNGPRCWVREGRRPPARPLALTVKHHLANARSKVGAATTAQLVWILAERLSEPGGRAQPDE